jgi:hypothetical protein
MKGVKKKAILCKQILILLENIEKWRFWQKHIEFLSNDYRKKENFTLFKRKMKIILLKNEFVIETIKK